jgi:hypothetical protein
VASFNRPASASACPNASLSDRKTPASYDAPETTIDSPTNGELWDDQNDREEDDRTVEKRVIGKDGKSYPAPVMLV